MRGRTTLGRIHGMLFRSCAGALLLLAFATCGRPTQPNVVIICVDTVRYDTFWLPETLGIEDNLTRWATSSIRFDAAQSAAPWTLPSVATVMTGLYPNRHLAGRFSEPVANLDEHVPSSLPPRIATLAETLSSHGYRTAAFFDNPFIDEPFDAIRGFAERHAETSDDRVVRGARRWLGENRAGGPLFLYVHLMSAHGVFVVPIEEVLQRAKALPEAIVAEGADPGPERICDGREPVVCWFYRAYARGVLDSRSSVASILEEIAGLQMRDRTIVVLFSDHGEEFYDHRAEGLREGGDPRGYYGAGHGHTLYQELLRVPLLVWHPGLDAMRVRTPISLADVTPSILDWVGISRSDVRFDGVSFANVTGLDTVDAFRERPLLSSGIAYGSDRVAVLQSDQKVVATTDPARFTRFDLRRDPGEHDPLPVEGTRRMAALLERYRKELERHAAQQQELDDEALQRLQSVGYLGGK